jgi:hypothetical protein
MGDLLALNTSGSSRGMLPDDVNPQNQIGQDFLRAKAGTSPYVGGGQIGPERGMNGYPFLGGAAQDLGNGGNPVGHTRTAQVVQGATPSPFSAGDRGSATAVPAIYAGNPDLTSGG